MPEENELKGLQVKAELLKLGEASRAYAQHLEKMINGDETHSGFESGRPTLSDRFKTI